MNGKPVAPPGLRFSHRVFLRRGAYAGAMRMGGLLSVFALQILLARLVADPAEYGKYAWGQSLLFMLGTIACLGLPVVAARFVASLDAQQNNRGSQTIIRAAARLLLRPSALLCVSAIALWLSWRPAPGESLYRDVTLLALLFAPVLTYAMFLRDIARARQWLGLSMLPMQLARPLTTAALVSLFWWVAHAPLRGEIVLLMVGLSVATIVVVQALLYRRRQARLEPGGAPGEIPAEYQPSRLLPTARPIFIVRCASMVITYANVIGVGFLAGPAAAGAYFAAERLAQLAGLPKTVVSMVNQQSMAAAHATGNSRDLQKLATQSAHGSLWPTLLASTALALFAGPLLHLFGREFTAASTVLIILVASGIINVFTGPAQDILMMTGRQDSIPKIMITSAIAHVTALALLVPSHGAVGAALASVLSGLCSQLWLLHLARRETGIACTVLASLWSRR
ncbi:MAG: hypothetical protein CME59_12790 [Halioglobus sp.]|nr:hypothetical protein [Halioglobus sp.]